MKLVLNHNKMIEKEIDNMNEDEMFEGSPSFTDFISKQPQGKDLRDKMGDTEDEEVMAHKMTKGNVPKKKDEEEVKEDTSSAAISTYPAGAGKAKMDKRKPEDDLPVSFKDYTTK